MADLVAYQSGDFTGATTFKGVATSTGAVQKTRAGNIGVTTAYQQSLAFTLTNGLVIEGVLLHGLRGSASGTVTIGLSDDNGATWTREVTINSTDLPTAEAIVFIKFATDYTADGGNDYRLGIKGSASNTGLFSRSTGTDWFRLFRISTTATIATTDRFFIAKELTGAGTDNGDITVTMNSTANTSYGGCDIGQGGVLSYGTSASTDYYLRLAGTLFVFSGGTLNIGTSGDRIPSTSTAVLQFNNASNVQFGLEAFNGSTVNIYGAQKGSTKVLLTADCNSGQASVTVEDTTGWANGDEIAVASTTRTASQSEKRTVSSVTSGTTATVTSNFSFTHQGTAPYQGEVINLTRNVKVQGTSATLQAYVNCAATSNFYADNCEFFWLGSGTGNKRGIDSATTSAGSFTLKDCAIRDFVVTSSVGVRVVGTTGSHLVENCVLFGIADVHILGLGVTSITGNWSLKTQTTGVNISVGGGVTASSNRAAGGGQAFSLGSGAIFTGNNGHSSAFENLVMSSGSGTISNSKFWRGGNSSVFVTANVTFENCDFYHSPTNLNLAGTAKIIGGSFDAGTGQSLGATATHIALNANVGLVVENTTFGATNIASRVLTTANSASAVLTNCTINETIFIFNPTSLISPAFSPTIGIDKLNGTSGSHRAYKRFGFSASDQSVYRTASPSEQLNPNDASGKLPSGSKKFGVANGNDATVSVWVRKSATYNGNEPRLIVKRNVIAGITTDTVLATASGGTDEWLELTGTTATVSDDCVLEVYVDCDGTAGVVNVDDWSIT
jgi:hypothetical protein